MFCMFCLVPKAGDRVGSEYTMANTPFSWKMEQKLLEAAPLPFPLMGMGSWRYLAQVLELGQIS